MSCVPLGSRKDLEDLAFDDFVGSLEAHEQHKKKKKNESLEGALRTKAFIKDENGFGGRVEVNSMRRRGNPANKIIMVRFIRLYMY